MSELRIPREDERKQIEEYYICVKKECIYVEALLSITYNMFKEVATPRVRCSKHQILLNPDSNICEDYSKRY